LDWSLELEFGFCFNMAITENFATLCELGFSQILHYLIRLEPFISVAIEIRDWKECHRHRQMGHSHVEP
jgi:hypothetical protein